MKKTIMKVAAVCLVAGAVLTGCTKEGPVGPAGANGTNGNANVTNQVFTLTTSNWGSTSTNWYSNITYPNATATALLGSVQVYYSINNGTSWTAMPCTVYGSVANYFFGVTTTVGNIYVTWLYNGAGIGSDPCTAFGVSSMQLNVVIIPPSHRLANPHVNLNNYEEVKATFHLK